MRAWMIATMLTLASACASTPAKPPSSPPAVSFFVVAHQDDWQLFMNPAAYHAMNEPQEKAVFVHVTAGDAGRGAAGAPVPFFLAREEGALRAVRFLANAANPESGLGATMQTATPTIAGHAVTRSAYANAVVYFLRLPDGFFVNGDIYTPIPQSLTRLRAGEVAVVETVDGGATYAGWDALVSTLAGIVETERRDDALLNLHIAETDDARNPRDHPDHRSTAFAMEAVATRFPCASMHRHVEYATRSRRKNVTGDDYLIDVGAWAATVSGLTDLHASNDWDRDHNAWLGRSYSRVQAPAAGCDTANPN